MFRVFTILALIFAANVQAQTQNEASEADAAQEERLAANYGDWSKICQTGPDGQVCHISQTVNQNNESRLFQTSIGYLPGSAGPVVFLTAPLGIYLPRGITIELSEDTLLSVAVQRCDTNGCLAVTTIDSAFLDELNRAEEGKLVFGSTAEQNVWVPLSLNGFAEALASIKPAN